MFSLSKIHLLYAAVKLARKFGIRKNMIKYYRRNGRKLCYKINFKIQE
jgi:hypothetical protein